MESKRKESTYVFSGSILSNIHKNKVYEFIRRKNLNRRYSDSGKNVEYFISEIINSGELSIEDLNEFLFEALFFGYHKDIFIRKIKKSNEILQNERNLKQILKNEYGIEELNYNEIATPLTNMDDEEENLVAFKIIKIDGKIEKLQMLYVKRIELENRDKTIVKSLSYIPVEIDIKLGIIIVKTYDKSKVKKDEYKYDVLANKVMGKVISIFNIEKCYYNDEHKQRLYEICKKIVDDMFEKMIGTSANQICETLDAVSSNIEKELNIIDIENKKQNNNIFDIKNTLEHMVENILISDYCYSFRLEKELAKIKGIVTYIKFNDETNVNAVIKGESYQKPVFDSDAFMGLRKSIENSQNINELIVIWNYNGKELRVRYDAKNYEYLKVHMYKGYDEGDFNYAIEKYRSFK